MGSVGIVAPKLLWRMGAGCTGDECAGAVLLCVPLVNRLRGVAVR